MGAARRRRHGPDGRLSDPTRAPQPVRPGRAHHARVLPGAPDRQSRRPLSADRRHAGGAPGVQPEVRLRPAAGRAVRHLRGRAQHARPRPFDPQGPAGDRGRARGLPDHAGARGRGHAGRDRLRPGGRRARRLPAGRSVRPGRQRRLAGRRQRARLLARDHRHPAVRGHAGLAADLGHRHRLALAHAGRRAGAAAVRDAGAGGARRDDRRAELALRQDGAGQGRPGAARSSSCTRCATPCCRRSRSRATSPPASSMAP